MSKRDKADLMDSGQLPDHPEGEDQLHDHPSRSLSTEDTIAVDTSIPATTGTPPTKFTLFPKLPPELRFKVYNLLLEPQAVLITIKRLCQPRHTISKVCKESKQEYERQYKILKKRASEYNRRIGPIFVNYSIDYVHFFTTRYRVNDSWARIMVSHMSRKFSIVKWLEPAQKIAIKLNQKRGNRGLCAPNVKQALVWEYFNRFCPNMKELVFFICKEEIPIADMVELRDFGGFIGEGETKLRTAFESAQLKGLNVAAKLVIMGSAAEWTKSNGKLVELFDVST